MLSLKHLVEDVMMEDICPKRLGTKSRHLSMFEAST